MNQIPAIANANLIPIGQGAGPTPNMRSTLMGWLRDLQLTIVKKDVVDFETVENETPLAGRGIWQPLSATRLALKPEGERAWRWFMILSPTDLVLITDDVIKRDGVPYRVMASGPWDDNAFRCYEIVNDYDRRGDERRGNRPC